MGGMNVGDPASLTSMLHMARIEDQRDPADGAARFVDLVQRHAYTANMGQAEKTAWIEQIDFTHAEVDKMVEDTFSMVSKMDPADAFRMWGVYTGRTITNETIKEILASDNAESAIDQIAFDMAVRAGLGVGKVDEELVNKESEALGITVDEARQEWITEGEVFENRIPQIAHSLKNKEALLTKRQLAQENLSATASEQIYGLPVPANSGLGMFADVPVMAPVDQILAQAPPIQDFKVEDVLNSLDPSEVQRVMANPNIPFETVAPLVGLETGEYGAEDYAQVAEIVIEELNNSNNRLEQVLKLRALGWDQLAHEIETQEEGLGINIEDIPPSVEEPIFNPLGQGYDMNTAVRYGLEPDPSGHWGSVAELSDTDAGRRGLPAGSAVILKALNHETWDLMEAEENRLGNEIIFHDGRYYSIPMYSDKEKRSGRVKAELRQEDRAGAMHHSLRMGHESRFEGMRDSTASPEKKRAIMGGSHLDYPGVYTPGGRFEGYPDFTLFGVHFNPYRAPHID